MPKSDGKQRSALFFSARFDPPELANFNLQNIFLRDRRGAVLEMTGPGLAIWWPSRPHRESDDLADMARAWFRTIPSAYYLRSGVALMSRMVGWVEALDVRVDEAVIGFADARFAQLPLPADDDPANRQMREAVRLARRLRGTGDLERASNELLASAYDTTPQSYLSAFRAVECVRRVYEPGHDKRAERYRRMWADLGRMPGNTYSTLRDAAKAVRHGDVPLRQSARHPVNVARGKRQEILDAVAALVERCIDSSTRPSR